MKVFTTVALLLDLSANDRTKISMLREVLD
jgi:hypothetical protein